MMAGYGKGKWCTISTAKVRRHARAGGSSRPYLTSAQPLALNWPCRGLADAAKPSRSRHEAEQGDIREGLVATTVERLAFVLVCIRYVRTP